MAKRNLTAGDKYLIKYGNEWVEGTVTFNKDVREPYFTTPKGIIFKVNPDEIIKK